MMMQLGYQKIIGKNEKLKFMVEGGLNVIFSKAQKNMIYLSLLKDKGRLLRNKN